MSEVDENIFAIIPAYNESLTIGSVVLETLEQVNKVIVIDDGSSDRTSQIATRAGAEILRLEVNQGKAAALLYGLRMARDQGANICVTIDADGQHHPQEIPRLLHPISKTGVDLVIGSRFLEEGNEVPGYRRLGQRVLNGATNVACYSKVTDSQSGFRALSSKALQNLDFTSEGYSIESDMIHYFSTRGLHIAEVPITVDYDVPHKHKKNPITHGLSVLGDVIRLVSQSRPLLLLGVPGITLTIAGLIMGFLSYLGIYIFGWGWMFQSGISISLFIIGFVMMMGSMVLNSLADLARRTVID